MDNIYNGVVKLVTLSLCRSSYNLSFVQSTDNS